MFLDILFSSLDFILFCHMLLPYHFLQSKFPFFLHINSTFYALVIILLAALLYTLLHVSLAKVFCL